MYARLLRHLSREAACHFDAAPGLAKHERCQVVERAPEARAPEDDIDSQEAAICPPHAILLDLAEHRAALQDATPPHRLDGRRDGDAGHRHDRPGRTAAPHPLLNEAHGPSSRLLIERA